MKTSLRILMMVLTVMIAVTSLTNAESKNPGRSKPKKRGVETSFHSKQMYQMKYSKCPKFSTQKRAFK
jgi:hypothetical protein